jgi:SAM-dependent methyltransferase
VHDDLASVAQRWFPAGAHVLDYGAGAGAFAQRLADLGYTVEATDVDPAKWAAPNIPFHIAEGSGVPQAFRGRTFDGVCCVEVIEHVEDQWQLLRDLRSLISDDGILILSTPNVTSFVSRALFLRSGRFHQFGDDDLSYGHISPLTAWEMEVLARGTGWQIVETTPAGHMPIVDLSHPSLRSAAGNLARLASWLLARGHKRGHVLVFVLRPDRGRESSR